MQLLSLIWDNNKMQFIIGEEKKQFVETVKI